MAGCRIYRNVGPLPPTEAGLGNDLRLRPHLAALDALLHQGRPTGATGHPGLSGRCGTLGERRRRAAGLGHDTLDRWSLALRFSALLGVRVVGGAARQSGPQVILT